MYHDSITNPLADKVLTYPLSVFDIDNYRHIINKFEDVMINKNIISNSISSETINSSNIISKSLNTDTLKTSSVESTDLKCNTINGLDIINGLTIHKCHIRIRDDDSSLKFEFDCYCIISKGYK